MASEEPSNNITNIDLAEEIKENGNNPEISPAISEERREEIINEITKLDDEIKTLRQALVRKETQLTNLRTELGETRWARLQKSQALQKSKQVLSDASNKTSQAFKSVGSMTANKWNEIRESQGYQNASERFWSTTGAMKAKLTGGNQTEIEQKEAPAPVVQSKNEPK